MNSVLLTGTLIDEPKKLMTAKRKTYVALALSVYRKPFMGKPNNDIIECWTFGKVADMAESAQKGMIVSVAGNLKYMNKFVDSEGNAITKLVVFAESLNLAQREIVSDDAIWDDNI